MPNESQERADRLDANVSLFALDKYASDTRPADIEFREVHELCKEIERLTHENARLQSIVTLRERATDEPAAPLDLRRYFKVSPVAVQGEPDACRLDFHVGVQTIPIGPEYCETAEHAEWWINVICKALQNVISAASRPAEPPVDIRPIETAPKDELALFWIVAKTAEESYTDTSGNPIVALSYTPHWELTKLGRWSSLLKATHWSPLPGAPSTKSEEPEPEHVCDGGWACHFHDVKKAADETSAAAELRASPPPAAIRTTDATLNTGLDKLGAIVNGQVFKVTPLEANRILTYLRELESLRTSEPPTDALTLEQLTAAIAYMGCDTDREYTPEAFARDLFAAARQSSTKSAVCEHDLQKPSHTVWVSDSGKVARCSACGQQWSPVETSERCDRPPPHNPGIPPTPRCRLLKGHEGPCDYPF